jgi:hypothetical protein
MTLVQLSRLVPLSIPRADIAGPAFANGPTTLHTSGHIDMRAQVEVRGARRSAPPK